MKFYLKRILICFFILQNTLLSAAVAVQDSTKLPPAQTLQLIEDRGYSISECAQVLVDSLQNISFEEAQNSDAFIPFNLVETPCSSKNAYWLKINILNQREDVIHWIFIIRSAPQIYVYIQSKNKPVVRKSIGFLEPFYALEYPTRFYYSSQCTVLMPTNSDTVSLWVHIKGDELKNFDLNANIYPQKYYIQNVSDRNFSQGIFIGIILIMIAYHLLLFRSVRDISFVYYSFYLLTIMLAFFGPFGFGWQILVGKYYLMSVFYIYFIQTLPAFFFLQFMQSFVQFKQVYPRLTTIINLLKYSTLISPTVAFAAYIYSLNLNLGFNIVNLNLIFILVGIFVSLFFVYRIKNVVSQYFVRGTLVLTILCFIGVVLLLKGFDSGTPQYVMQTGVVIQILLFAIGLGKKIRITELERNQTQQKLIEQLRENDALQTKVNRELEQKVKERTALIEYQKKEIEDQRDVLQLINHELEHKNEEISLQKRLLEKSHLKITDSITYAKRIQDAVLPQKNSMDLFFPQNFILFKPRDIVSGDFYFIKKIRDYILIAAADCTGHGVPGAFMSMLGTAMLNEIVRNSEISTSAQVLSELRNQIKNSLQQTGLKTEQQDGMDIAFCAINTQTLNMSFAGAHNPCWIFRGVEFDLTKEDFDIDNEKFNHENNKQITHNSKLITLEADRMPVGVFLKEKPFTEHTFQLQTGDVFYIFSDGYHSQFGGAQGHPLKSKYLKQTLSEICHLPMNEQQQILENKFDTWRGTNEQTDDVLVLGVRV